MIRVTQASALPTVLRLTGDLTRWVQEAGHLSSGGNLAEGADALQAFCKDTATDVEVALGKNLDAGHAARVATWLGAGLEGRSLLAARSGGSPLLVGQGLAALQLHIRDANQPTVTRAGKPRPSVLVCVLPSADSMNDEGLKALDKACEDRPYAILIAPISEPLNPVKAQMRSGVWHLDVVDLTGLSEPTLPVRLSNPPWDGATKLMRAHSAARALDALSKVFALTLEQETRALKVKRGRTQQKVT